MFQQNTNNSFFVCVTNSRKIMFLFHQKAIPHDSLQKFYPNLGRMCKNKIDENKIKFNWLNLSKILRIIKQVFIRLLSLGGSLPTKCVSLSNKLCMARPNLIALNPFELYLFMMCIDKCNGSCNAVDE